MSLFLFAWGSLFAQAPPTYKKNWDKSHIPNQQHKGITRCSCLQNISVPYILFIYPFSMIIIITCLIMGISHHIQRRL